MGTKEMFFLGKRLTELREKNGINTLQAMAEKINAHKSTLSRAENGLLGETAMNDWVDKYCHAFGFTESQIKQFLRGEKIAIPDTSALLKNPQLIDELDKEYNKVVIPDIVLNELDKIKNNHGNSSLRKRAWEIIRSITYGERIIRMNYEGESGKLNDEKIIAIAKAASDEFSCGVQVITNDIDYSAFLKGNTSVTSLHLREYTITKQNIINMTKLMELDKCYADSYEDYCDLSGEEINAYLPNGYTLIISVVRNISENFERRKSKIKWLIAHGADVDKRDNERRYFPPLSHAIQNNDYAMFNFLLNECKANPNVGSRNPYDAGKVRQKNEGNTPLMVAAWDDKANFVKALCADERTSINQQDGNGFTALIKASCNGFRKCRDILLDAGADTKITDIDGLTYEDHYNNYLEKGPLRHSYNNNRRHYK